ncbi:MAG: selenocysteine lyase/cysteine desulfurase [Gammaproteobacteria bacterium]|jgi:selenocysteine lyase/cysteine desulfurase
MKLDLDFVRQQFDQLNDEPDFIFASNAGGSYVCNQVNRVVEHYNRHTRVQPYSRFSPSSDAGQAMDRSKSLWSAALGIEESELTIGPSTSINTYVMSHSIGEGWKPGDEIIVTNQDHEANSGVWRRKALEKGVSLKEWRVEETTGLLQLEDLKNLLTDKTRWVFFTHCSNIVGTTNPVADIVKLVKANSAAKTFVDAVAYAPHHVSNLKFLGVDAYTFSLYKVFGPHQSLLYVNQEVANELATQAHYFLDGQITKAFNPAGPQHAQVAACAGVIDYFDALHQHHFGASDTASANKMSDIHGLIQNHENNLADPILEVLSQHSQIRLIGKADTSENDRAPTIAFKPLNQSSQTLAYKLQDLGIGAENGNFYAHRLMTDLGIDPEDGVVRVSLVHYARVEDAERIAKALQASI